MAPAKSAAELRSAWTGEGTRPHTCTAIAPGIRLIYIEQDVYHRRTIRTSGSNHGKVAGSGRMPVGSRTDLRHHQALHAGRDLRSPRSDRQSRLAGIDGRIGRPAVTGAVLFANGKRGRALLGGRCAGPAFEQTVDRHPHVFGDVKADTPAEVLRNWEALKAEEKKKRLAAGGPKKAEQADADHPQSVLAGVSSKMPALMEAYKLSSRAAHVGFDWPEMEGLFEKLEEETAELREELKAVPVKPPSRTGIAGSGKPQVSAELRGRLEDEVGDLFFVLVNIARYLSLDPESALRKTNRKFKRRFQWMEERLRASGRAPQQASMDELETLWQQAKRAEKPS